MDREKFKIKNLKSKLDENKLDLSLLQLTTVPVKEIVDLKKVTELDLSRNRLDILPKDFGTLVNLVELDLSSNSLTSLCEEFGNLHRLQRLDLYKNQLKDLPLSFCKLKQLKWLDLNGNPLNEQLFSVAGDFSSEKEYRNAASKVVQYMQKRQSDNERERQKHLSSEREKEAARKLKEETERKKAQLEKKKLKEMKKKSNTMTNGKDVHKELSDGKQQRAQAKGVNHGRGSKEQRLPAKKSRRTCCSVLRTLMLCVLYATLIGAVTTCVLAYVACTRAEYDWLVPDSEALCSDARHLFSGRGFRVTWPHARLPMTAAAFVGHYFADVRALFWCSYDYAVRTAPVYYDRVRQTVGPAARDFAAAVRPSLDNLAASIRPALSTFGAVVADFAAVVWQLVVHAFEIVGLAVEWAAVNGRWLLDNYPQLWERLKVYWHNAK